MEMNTFKKKDKIKDLFVWQYFAFTLYFDDDGRKTINAFQRKCGQQFNSLY